MLDNNESFSSEIVDYIEELDESFDFLQTTDLNLDSIIDILDLVRAEMNSYDEPEIYNENYLLDLGRVIMGIYKCLGAEIEENGDIVLPEIR